MTKNNNCFLGISSLGNVCLLSFLEREDGIEIRGINEGHGFFSKANLNPKHGAFPREKSFRSNDRADFCTGI